MAVLDRCQIVQNSEFFPVMNIIVSITNSNPATVVTHAAHGYIDGIIARLDIPPADGMQQANGITGTITVVDDVTFTIDINTTNFDTFAIPSDPTPHDQICAQVVPIGEVNSTLQAALQNIL